MMDLEIGPITDGAPESITFKITWESLQSGAFGKGRAMTFHFGGTMHIMIVSLVEKLDDTTVRITATHSNTPRPSAEFRATDAKKD